MGVPDGTLDGDDQENDGEDDGELSSKVFILAGRQFKKILASCQQR